MRLDVEWDTLSVLRRRCSISLCVVYLVVCLDLGQAKIYHEVDFRPWVDVFAPTAISDLALL